MSDLEKIRALLGVVAADGGSVTLSGESAALVAQALGELAELRAAHRQVPRADMAAGIAEARAGG